MKGLMEAVANEIGCRFWALVHHDDLAVPRDGLVDLKHYPAAVVRRLVRDRHMRRDPVIRGCLFADSAFVWSDLPSIIALDRSDEAALAFGARWGLNEGISVPSCLLGDCIGSCTFAGMRRPETAPSLLGLVQMIGVFAFQAARRLHGSPGAPRARPRLHPRPRDCVALAGRGYSNKEIARALGLAPRTVDGYLTEARRLFDAHDRTELVVSAILAGEVGLHELRRGQPG
ncbi:autoinducer binding domain-containing protein [Sphingobium sp. V4]|uniref:helix-turn-helix transcriptional regulator n=1 Tax=Sphingobium sp. V4 TaxID=3038927 RepID=UPI002557EDB1|nr:LuxR family transcriptional regulator [Sphingobium sp. V4]WIW88051.1 autoinducer binding domain-containing protein [Sphingobium sp. V4]